ncbi:hybrid sensor histidine kinase/response regulator transcription factor [Chondrinema litorale]|uniref:hybrid sensor histidine kinase/response regulator transcription factor n=1 Tax=Chondrinema litorale TaxID=2994555 RepID=UPI0025427256|nr:substrate-binding domain-containing protein [Chondrinema litorale]UZR96549.1 substrate-binding domain-containing protein [Chondrinema litorale]
MNRAAGLINYYLYQWFLITLILTSCTESTNDIKYRIGFSQCTDADQWRRVMHEEMQREIAFHPEVELIIKNAANSSNKQIQQIKDLLEEDIDLLIVSPNEAAPITPIIEEIYRRGIPVIVIDRKISSSSYTSYVGANNYEIGSLAGKYAAELLNGKGKIIEITGLKGSTPAIERHNGFTQSLKNYPNIEIVKEVEGKWEIDTVKQVFPAILDTIQQANLVFAHNDIMGLGAYEISKQIGRENDIKFIGIDGLAGSNAGLQFVNDGILDATFTYPTGGELSINIALDLLNGKTVSKENILQTTLINNGNIKVMKLQSDKIVEQQKDILRQTALIESQKELYQNQKILMYILLASLSCSLGFGAYILYSLKEKQQTFKKLKAKNKEITKQRNQIEKMALKAEEATQAKLKFFTNISHEFRTPLTLIMAAVEELKELSQHYTSQQNKDLNLINRNAARLLRLINQLMDFRKIENSKMQVYATKHNIVKFIKEIMVEFENLANKNKIDFHLTTNTNQLNIWFDSGMLDKVLFNLLSNAFKFTRDGDFIRIGIEERILENKVLLVVEDSGSGMTPEHVKFAFDRFYKGNNYETFGTGLGLALSKEMIKLHHGNLDVSSEMGKGTRFEIELQLGKNHFSTEQLSNSEDKDFKHTEIKFFLENLNLKSQKEKTIDNSQSKNISILIIEDNDELRNILSEKLKKEYEVFEASNGKTGLDKAYDKIPDLIISDVMLPKMDGLKITKTLKEDIKTSHIPIILLTSKNSVEQKIEGIQTGADAYIIKPFNFKFLEESIKNILKNRDALKKRYSHELPLKESSTNGNSLDKKFINSFKIKVEENISNASYSANEIADELGLSRVQLYRKIKALLGVGINDYIKSIRLKKAKILMLESDLTISEIAYEVGFSSPAYFSTAFKTKYKLSPSDFLKKEHSSKS